MAIAFNFNPQPHRYKKLHCFVIVVSNFVLCYATMLYYCVLSKKCQNIQIMRKLSGISITGAKSKLINCCDASTQFLSGVNGFTSELMRIKHKLPKMRRN